MRYTEEQMDMIIKEWQQSGLTKKEFCLQRGLAYHTFHYWSKRLTSVAGFSEVKIPSSTSNTCELIFPSGARMLFAEPPSTHWLRELVS